MSCNQLTDEQQRIVTDNHNLIYWYARNRNLNIDDWYDLLAIEFCETVMKWNKERGTLSNYFKKRMDNKLINHMNSINCQKRKAEVIQYVEELHQDDGVENDILLQELLIGGITPLEAKVLKMKYAGYTHKEVCEVLNISGVKLRKIIAKLRKEYHNEYKDTTKDDRQ